MTKRETKPPIGEQWVHEIKYDGYRLQVHRDGERVRIFTRRGFDWTDRFPVIASTALTLKAGRFVLDGEGVVTDAAGVTVFDQLYGHRRYTTAFLQAFDLLSTVARESESSLATSTSTIAAGRIRALTAAHPIKPTSLICRSAR
jgi:ATP-dependent DNA ligase